MPTVLDPVAGPFCFTPGEKRFPAEYAVECMPAEATLAELTPVQSAHFRTFGYVGLRELFTPEEMEQISRDYDDVMNEDRQGKLFTGSRSGHSVRRTASERIAGARQTRERGQTDASGAEQGRPRRPGRRQTLPGLHGHLETTARNQISYQSQRQGMR